MVGTSFYRAGNGKCPKCGTFSVEQDDFHRCPTCTTIFNEYVVLEEGADIDLKNN